MLTIALGVILGQVVYKLICQNFDIKVNKK